MSKDIPVDEPIESYFCANIDVSNHNLIHVDSDGEHIRIGGFSDDCDTVETFSVGQAYTTDQLPENQMSSSDKPEMVGDDLYAIALSDGRLIEFKRAYECTAVVQIDTDDGSIDEVLKGIRR